MTAVGGPGKAEDLSRHQIEAIDLIDDEPEILGLLAAGVGGGKFLTDGLGENLDG